MLDLRTDAADQLGVLPDVTRRTGSNGERYQSALITYPTQEGKPQAARL
jgi:hypothetical protein